MDERPEMAKSCVTVIGFLGAGSKSARLRSRFTDLYESFDDHTVPSNVSSDVSRQYDRTELLTLNTAAPLCCTSRSRMETNGLTVVRELFPPLPVPRFFQEMSDELPAPGRDGPRISAAATATAPITSAGRASAARPPRDRLANQAAARVRGPI